MIVLRCDRCGVVFDVPEKTRAEMGKGDFWPGALYVTVGSEVVVRGDFCPTCAAAITNYIENPPPMVSR